MFSKSHSKSSDRNLPSNSTTPNGDIPSIIAADLKIVGNLICGGSIEVEGEIEGNVTCAHVTVRRSGAVKGDVTADQIQVDGEINGLVKGKDINLSESGRVTGVIMYESLSVKDGAYIDGQCKSADRLHKGAVEEIEIEEGAIEALDDKSAEMEENELESVS